MTLEQWNRTISPKLSGSWNLHSSLPRTLDFFILLSSVVSVIGNVSQANYAAGNAYMDALAHYRRSQGLPAVSLNVGLVSDSDHVIDGTSMDQYLERFGHMASVSTTLAELDVGLVAAMRGTTADGSPVRPQIVFGMTAALRRQGVAADQWARDRKFDHRVGDRDAEDRLPEDQGRGHWRRQMEESVTMQDAQGVAQSFLKELVAPGLGVQPAEIGDGRPLYDVGGALIHCSAFVSCCCFLALLFPFLPPLYFP